mgnify:CR=1 FL=1
MKTKKIILAICIIIIIAICAGIINKNKAQKNADKYIQEFYQK